MPEQPKDVTEKARIHSFVSPHVVIASIGGKQVWLNIPANSPHPEIGDFEVKKKWKRRDFSKDEVDAFEARKKEFAKMAAGDKVGGSEKDK